MGLVMLVSALGLFSSAIAAPKTPGAGTSLELARQRANQLRHIHYKVEFLIPKSAKEPIEGNEEITFELQSAAKPVVLDFQAAKPAGIKKLVVNSHGVATEVRSGHFTLPTKFLRKGKNFVSVDFTAGSGGFQRRDDFLYTLFVPNKASQTFPCFDQPDLKAKYALSVRIPEKWTAVAQGFELPKTTENGFHTVRFAETLPTSTYLFAFAAGQFNIVKKKVEGREMRMFHRESDIMKVSRNEETVFALHGKSLKWLEDYTGIPYPYAKFDFVVLPAFPFGGMEHPGSIFYSDKGLFLEESATPKQIFDRAHLIAHETSHMWFGNLVTMKWFNDVWLKEVFANFMADKIVNPLFPEINHEIQFLFAHYPNAYGVDRTPGTNPIQQKLTNLNNASSLYGAIIYNKAPIVMRQLEQFVGEENFRQGLKGYLKRYSFGNAEWKDLLKFFGKKLSDWNKAWIEQTGRPKLSVKFSEDKKRLLVSDPLSPHPKWPQPLNDQSYGLFEFDEAGLKYIQERIENIPDENLRAVLWIQLWENLLERKISIEDYLQLAVRALPKERQDLTIDFILKTTKYVYWALLTPEERAKCCANLEKVLWTQTQADYLSMPAKTAFFKAYQDLFTTDEAWKTVYSIWAEKTKMKGIKFAESDWMTMAYALALRKPDEAKKIKEAQLKRIHDNERKNEFQFIMQAVSANNDANQTSFFASLRSADNRKNEPWVVDALIYLHHPLHGTNSRKFVGPSLELLPEIKNTSGIFFPLKWLNATLGYHNDLETRRIVETYLNANPDLDAGLKLKLLQAADTLMRFTN